MSFGYAGGQNIVSSFNLSIRKGEMVGLIGPSGAGKTTIVDLLLRLFRPQNGELLIDGTNIDEVDKKSWHDNIGYVSQDIFLINTRYGVNMSLIIFLFFSTFFISSLVKVKMDPAHSSRRLVMGRVS